MLEFLPERKCVRSARLKLADDEEMAAFPGGDYADLVDKFAEPHADIGSGVAYPACITRSGYLVQFRLQDATVTKGPLYNLLTGKKMENEPAAR